MEHSTQTPILDVSKTPNKLARCLELVAGWLIIAPISKLTPKRKDCVVVLGRGDGSFIENTKYFLLNAKRERPNIRFVFVTELPETASMLNRHGVEALVYPSYRSILFLLRASSVVVDAERWAAKYRIYLLSGAKIVQLWHGVPIKKVQRAIQGTNRNTNKLFDYFCDRHKIFTHVNIQYDLVIAPSEFYLARAFKPSFWSRHFLVANYPRNSFGCNLPVNLKALDEFGADTHILSRIINWKREGKTVVMFLPTYRDTRSTPLALNDKEVLKATDDWCRANSTELVFKFHPRERGVHEVYGQHLHLCDSRTGAYPLLKYADALITDYSSISFDFLWRNKPIIYFCPDLDDYRQQDRDLYFPYESMIAGPRTENWEDTLFHVKTQLDCDTYYGERDSLKKIVFGRQTPQNSTKRIIQFMERKDWINQARDQKCC